MSRARARADGVTYSAIVNTWSNKRADGVTAALARLPLWPAHVPAGSAAVGVPPAPHRAVPAAYEPVRARSGRADPVLAALAALVLLTGVAIAADLGGPVTQVTVFWILMGGTEAVLCLLAWRACRLPPSAAHRRMWRAMSLAAFVWTVGVCLQIPTVADDPRSLEAALGGPAYSVCVLVGTLWVVWVMLTSPLGLGSHRERVRFWLDLATVMVAAGTFGCYITSVSAPGPYTGPAGELLRQLVGPTAFLVALFAVVKLLLGGQAPFTLAAGALGAAGAGVEGLTRGLQSVLIEHHRVSWVFGLQVAVIALLTASARVQQRQVQADPDLLYLARRRPYSLLPYVAVGVVYLLLVGVLATTGLDAAAWIVVTGAIGSTALVVVRQLAAFTDNARLLAELDSKVRELHAALGERDRLAAQLRRQAFHDNLTGLANRALFLQRLDEATGRPAAGAEADLAVMLIDLDDFKPVNDRLGHAAGDLLLTEMGRRLRGCVRDTDLVARLGGDEFAVLVAPLPPDLGLAALAERVVRAVGAPYRLTDAEVTVTASVGVTLARPGEQGASAILHHADMAMYTAKNRGKGTFQIGTGRDGAEVDTPAAAVRR
jgi:diguanylate cyclase (GGDEF)-like protein